MSSGTAILILVLACAAPAVSIAPSRGGIALLELAAVTNGTANVGEKDSNASTGFCCGRAEGIAEEAVHESIGRLEEQAIKDREKRNAAVKEVREDYKDMMYMKDQETAAKLKTAEREATQAAEVAAKQNTHEELASIAREAGDAAREEAERQFAAMDAARATREISKVMRDQEVADANKAIDLAYKSAIQQLADNTAGLVSMTASAASNTALAKATAEAALHLQEKAAMQGVQGKVVAASAAAAKTRTDELQKEADISSEMASRSAAIAAQDAVRAKEADDALKAFLSDAELAKADAAKAQNEAAAELSQVALDAMDSVKAAQEEYARAMVDAESKYASAAT